MKYGIIYIATNKLNNKSYIGQTINSLPRRITNHKNQSKNKNGKFSNAIKKYGIDGFDWKILYKVSIDQLDLAEICAIYIYNTYYGGYNSTPGGNNPMLDETIRNKYSERFSGKGNPMYGRIYTEEEKLHISKITTGIPKSEEMKEKISLAQMGNKNSFYGKTHSEETKKEYSKNRTGDKHHLYGKHHTEETKIKLSQSHKGQPSPMKGRKHNISSIIKMSESSKGQVPWNKGLKSSEEAKEKMRGKNNPMYGKPAANRGKPMSDETKKRISDAKKGKIPWNKGLKKSDVIPG